MLLLALVVGMVAYVIVRLQMINLELTWLRQYMMRLLSKEVASVAPTSKSDDEIDEVRSVDDEEHGCVWNGVTGQHLVDEVLEDAVGVEAVLANPTGFVVLQDDGPPNAPHEERITEIERPPEPEQGISFENGSRDNNDRDSSLEEPVEDERRSDVEDDRKDEPSRDHSESCDALASEEDEEAVLARSDHSRSSRRKSRSRK